MRRLHASGRATARGVAFLHPEGERLEPSPEGGLDQVADRLQKPALTVPVGSRHFR